MSACSIRYFNLLTLLTLALFPPSASAGQIEGVVYLRDGRSRVPLAGVFVQAVRNGRIEQASVARTGRDGNYRLSGLPPGMYTVQAVRDGYGPLDTTAPGGSVALVDCTTVCPADPLDFEMVTLGIVSGVVVDVLGEQVEGAHVVVDGAEALTKPLITTTDDRGQFRFAGLPPGQFTLRAESNRGASRLITSSIGIHLDQGETAEGFRLVMQAGNTFTISGAVRDLEARRNAPGSISLRSLSPHGRNYSVRIAEDVSFHFEGVAEGRYLAEARIRGVGESPAFLGVLSVNSDLSGLTLSPLPTAALKCHVRSSDGQGIPTALQLVSNDGFPERIIRVDQRDAQAEVSGVIPGSYRIRAESPNFYIESVRRDQQILSAESVAVPPGTVKLEVVMGSVSSTAERKVRNVDGSVASPSSELVLTNVGELSRGTAAQ